MTALNTREATAKSEKPATDVGSVFVSNYPPFSAWSAEALTDLQATLMAPPAREVDLGLYLHLPFCRKRCKFCYFRVYTDKNADDITRYLAALAREVDLYSAQPAVRDRPLRFVYFGGGTPSYVAVKHLQELITRLRTAMPWDHASEITFECEPGTLTEAKVAAYRELGITRLSLGIEHFDDDILRENGRAHLSPEIYRCLPWIRDQDFPQLNIDLIAGMVGETWETWRATVAKTIAIDPDSVTIYQMELPYNTIYSQDILAGSNSPVADWATKREWHNDAIEQFLAAGYTISSAYTVVKPRSGKNGQSPRFVYRDALWHGVDMLGTGVSSFGHLQGVHYQNSSRWETYLAALEADRLPWDRAFCTQPRDRLTRELILQLKLGRLEFAPFRHKFGVDPGTAFRPVFEQLAAEGMLRLLADGSPGIYRGVELTRTGLLQVDRLLPHFYAEPYRNIRYT